jgi:hypothetical protein
MISAPFIGGASEAAAAGPGGAGASAESAAGGGRAGAGGAFGAGVGVGAAAGVVVRAGAGRDASGVAAFELVPALAGDAALAPSVAASARTPIEVLSLGERIRRGTGASYQIPSTCRRRRGLPGIG